MEIYMYIYHLIYISIICISLSSLYVSLAFYL